MYSQSFQISWLELGEALLSLLSTMLNLLVSQDQKPLLMHVILFRIWVRPRYFSNGVMPVWPGQNVTRILDPFQHLHALFTAAKFYYWLIHWCSIVEGDRVLISWTGADHRANHYPGLKLLNYFTQNWKILPKIFFRL